MRWHYREVGYGTRFEKASGWRTDLENPGRLHENELAVDVGSVCWGLDGTELRVIDRNPVRPGNFPGAAASVLHLAGKIQAWAASGSFHMRTNVGRSCLPPMPRRSTMASRCAVRGRSACTLCSTPAELAGVLLVPARTRSLISRRH